MFADFAGALHPWKLVSGIALEGRDDGVDRAYSGSLLST
jgi:hypothetical protein